ncbi:MAG: hypothetical protein IKZ38_03795 [Clostridia bacterium]|nr:hypothetical protein [Clostridia bacterium]
MPTVYLILATVCIGSQFLLQKLYQKKFCKTFLSIAFFPVLLALFMGLIYFALAGFRLEVAGFTLLMAFFLAITNAHNNLVGLVIMKHCNMSFYSMFLMMGGMFLPFWYGVLLSPVKELLTVFKVVGLAFLIAGLLLVSLTGKGGKKSSKTGLILCVCVFIMNGFQSTITKIHQTYANIGAVTALNSEQFVIWTMIFTTILSFAVYGVIWYRERKKIKALKVLGEIQEDAEDIKSQTAKEGKKFNPLIVYQALLIIVVVLVYATSGLTNVKAQLTLPASMVFPITTGGSIVIMSLGGMVFYKEKLNTLGIVGIVFAIISVVLFSL